MTPEQEVDKIIDELAKRERAKENAKTNELSEVDLEKRKAKAIILDINESLSQLNSIARKLGGEVEFEPATFEVHKDSQGRKISLFTEPPKVSVALVDYLR